MAYSPTLSWPAWLHQWHLADAPCWRGGTLQPLSDGHKAVRGVCVCMNVYASYECFCMCVFTWVCVC